MVVRSLAAPPTPLSKSLADPKIDATAYVHSFSNIIGDVRIGANVSIAPGTSIRADEGSPFYIGEGTNVGDGVVIHGLEQGRVVGDDQNQYSVWIGKNTSITQMVLIHGPAYVGDNCFIGFRSTIFNARVGNGCIVMMHTLIQDVEIPPNKYVASGSVITNQQQADRLPNVQAEDLKFASHVMGINDALRTGSRTTSLRNEVAGSRSNGFAGSGSSSSLSPEVVEQVRNLLAQGYNIGTEHVDQRRFRTGSWASCSPINTNSEAEAIRELESCLAEHSGEYVRLFGINPKAKQRVLETIIQRPDGSTSPAVKTSASTGFAASTSSPRAKSSKLSQEIVEQIRQILAQGYKIGTEHVDQRRFRTGSWQSCGLKNIKQESEAIAAVEASLAEYQGEYVRLIGIEPKAKRRVVETIIQRPDGIVSDVATNGKAITNSPSKMAVGSSSSSSLSSQTIEQLRNLLASGYKIGTEHVDQRRFRTGSWASCSPINTNSETEAIAALEDCIANHAGEYVRLFGIDPKNKQRVGETIIQRP